MPWRKTRIDIFLQPMVTLPQRKVRYYEAVTRLRDDGLAARRRRVHRSRGSRRPDRADRPCGDAEMRAGAAPADGAQQGCRRVLQRRRGDAGQSRNLRAMHGFSRGQPRAGAILRARIQAGDVPQSRSGRANIWRRWRNAVFVFLDQSRRRLRIEPRELADRGVRFIKVPAALLLDPKTKLRVRHSPFDLSDLLGRFGIDLITERRTRGRTRRGRPARLRCAVRPGIPCSRRRGRCGPRAHLLPAELLRPRRRTPMAPARLLPPKRLAVDPAAGDRQRRAGAAPRGPGWFRPSLS